MSQQNQNLTLTVVWGDVLEGIKRVHEDQKMTIPYFMQLHARIQSYCANPVFKIEETRSIQTKPHNEKTSNATICGEDLYKNISDYLTNYLENISQKGIDQRSDAILHFYTDEWDRYRYPSQVIDGFCLYLNEHWVRQTKTYQDNIYEIFFLAMKIWEQTVFQSLNQVVTQACLDLIQSERNNNVINTNSISKVVLSYVALACTGKPSDDRRMTPAILTIYKEYFEVPFLRATEEFYRSEAIRVLQRNSVSEYLRKVAQRLDEEVYRVQLYLHPSTLSVLIKKVEDILIRDQLEVIYDESKILLRDDRHEDLRFLFKLLCRVPNATDRLKIIVQNHICQVGLDAIKGLGGSAVNNSKLYIETILDVHGKFFKVVKKIFAEKEQDFLVALNMACAQFINKNAITQGNGNATKSAELLARYCDLLLRKGNRRLEESVLEQRLMQIMIIFGYLEDKDVFLEFYRRKLAKRLVEEQSASDDHEGLMVSKLKTCVFLEACGFEYVIKLYQMFKDIATSKMLMEKYPKNSEFEFSVMVLTSNAWRLSVLPKFALPIKIKEAINNFTEFYAQQHSGRKLMCSYEYSKGELETLFTTRKHVLQLSTYQMSVLLLFNKQTKWTKEQIQDRTQISEKILPRLLSPLLKIKLLICDQIDMNKEWKDSNLQAEYEIKLADNFTNKNVRINLYAPSKSVEQKDNEVVQRDIDDDRKYSIQAAIVRIMKARQRLEHALLMKEVIQQLTSKFRPNVSLIKDCISILIEKDHLKRDPNEKKVLLYVA